MFPRAITTAYEFLHGKQDAVFRDEIYVPVGTILVISTIVLCVLYYYFLNGLRARFNRTRHWALTLLLNVVLNTVAVAWISYGLSDDANFETAVLILCLVDALYAALAFTVASFALKWLSPHASCTPV
jgi:peptidoglycan biosynthesis protein MviN/MurJ (putative lipid II flippase)